MPSKKLPAILWYPGDWRKDPGVQSLDYFDRGVWFEILMLMHEGEMRGKLTLNGTSMPDDALSQILGIEKAKLKQTLTKLVSYGVASIEQETGILVNRRMLRDEHLRKIRVECGSKGGRPPKTKAKPHDNQNLTPSVSVSVSSSVTTDKHTSSPPGGDGVGFEEFWKTYPRKVGKGAAQRAWHNTRKIRPANIVAIVESHKRSPAWIKEDGQFIPHPATWLNQHRWEDEVKTAPATSAPSIKAEDQFEFRRRAEEEYAKAKRVDTAEIAEKLGEAIPDSIRKILKGQA